jgi:hypothetical protein
MPWETESAKGKYQYYPQGDASSAPKDAPSAVNVVIVPDVNLPKVRPGNFPFDTGQHGLDQYALLIRISLRVLQGMALLIFTAASSREVQQMGQGWLLDS